MFYRMKDIKKHQKHIKDMLPWIMESKIRYNDSLKELNKFTNVTFNCVEWFDIKEYVCILEVRIRLWEEYMEYVNTHFIC